MIIFIPILLFAGISSLLLTIDFLAFIFGYKHYLRSGVFKFCEFISMLASPVTFLAVFDIGRGNKCCGDVIDTAFFSPGNDKSVYILITICIVAYYSVLRTKMAAPIFEVLVNSILFSGIVLNVLIAMHYRDDSLWIIGNPPIIILLFYRLIANQKEFLASIALPEEHKKHSLLNRVAGFILKLNVLLQIPILAIIALPLIFLLSMILMIFGQKPDSLIRSFTDTYKHGFSQLDYQCNGVVCDGHYLCTIAAKGHPSIVKPVRMGKRANLPIVCNRQLLISNAFEELLQERVPWMHRPIRKTYNRIGNSIHRHYWLFNYRLISDLIYVLMKPAEWFFLFILYLFDQKHEERIRRQYLL